MAESRLQLLALLAICQLFPQSHQYDPHGWKAAADLLLEAMDPTAKPCRNFYRYACGNWEKNTKGEYGGVPQQATKLVIDRLLKVIQGIKASEPGTPEYQVHLKTFYQQCLSAPKDYDQLLISVYKATFNHIGHMPLLNRKRARITGSRAINPYYLIAQAQRFLNTKLLVDVGLQLGQDECENIPMITLSSAFGEGKPGLKVDDSFPAGLVRIAAQYNIQLDQDAVEQRIERIKEIELEMMDFSGDVTEYKDAIYRYRDLSEKVNRNIDWMKLFSGLFESHMISTLMKKNMKILFYKPVQYFYNLDRLVSKYSVEDLLDYAYLRMFSTSLEHYTITPKLLHTDVTNISNEERCLEYVLKHASAAAARVFFENIGPQPDTRMAWKWKEEIELLSEAVFASFRYMIHTAEWIAPEDRSSIIKKLNAIPFFGGIPDWILDDDSVSLNTPPSNPQQSLFDNVIEMYKQKFDFSFEPLLRTAKQLEHDVDVTYVDKVMVKEPEPAYDWAAFYNREINKISVSMGLLLPPMFNYSYPLAMKFGVVGWIIGHEMIHGFDAKSVRVPVGGSRQLSEQTLAEFEERTNCINKQYSGYCYKKEGYCVSGQKTLNDNMADMEGLKMAYMAYKFLTQLGGVRETLPGLEHVTQDQLFFLSAARIWCGTKKEGQIYQGTNDEHAPGRARIELSMMNFPAFAQAFHCPAGAKFAPLHTCDMWGDFLEPNIPAANRSSSASNG